MWRSTSVLQLWRDHIQFFVDYTLATKANDAAGRQTAERNLAGYVQGISALIAGANPNLPRPVLEETFSIHVRQLAGAVDAYAAGDYPRTYRLVDEAYMHMVMSGTALATGIVAQFPQQFGLSALPIRLPNTGDGSCGQDGAGDCE